MRGAPTDPPPVPLQRAPAKQARIRDLKKVCILPTAHNCADAQEVLRLKRALEAPDAPVADLEAALRALTCYSLDGTILVQTKVCAIEVAMQLFFVARALCTSVIGTLGKGSWKSLMLLSI